MKLETKQMIDLYYQKEISSQKLIQYISKNEILSNEEIYSEYHCENVQCPNCKNIRKYSGFKHGYRCSAKCGFERRKQRKILKNRIIYLRDLSIEDQKKLILKNITKLNFISLKFLKNQNISEKDCYNLVFGSSLCEYCLKEAKFINWANGYKNICSCKDCELKQRSKRTKTTNILRYGVENVSSNKNIQKIKQQTFESNYSVKNISQLGSTQKKIRETNESKGRWVSLEQLGDKQYYERLVRKQTESLNLMELENFNLRGPVERDGWHLDHIFSVSEGFKNNIPIYLIANINNLRMIPARENQSKNFRCEITLDELLQRCLT